jgi:ribosomal protein S27E
MIYWCGGIRGLMSYYLVLLPCPSTGRPLRRSVIMPVTVRCQGCKSTLKIRDELAGKKIKCPKCATVLAVPKAEEEVEEFAPVKADERISDAPRKGGKPAPRRHDPDEEEDDRPRKGRRDDDYEDEEEEDRPRKGARSTGIRTSRDRRDDYDDEDDRPRRGRRDRDEEDEEEDDRPRKGKYKPCPRCRARGPKKVTWTPWGSFYGPAMFSHVRCQECGYAYNGKTGGSNLIPAILFVAVPLIGILGIIGGLAFVLFQRGYFK